jgi:hypothetical protein
MLTCPKCKHQSNGFSPGYIDLLQFKRKHDWTTWVLLRHCATSRKVAVSILGMILEILHWQSFGPHCGSGVYVSYFYLVSGFQNCPHHIAPSWRGAYLMKGTTLVCFFFFLNLFVALIQIGAILNKIKTALIIEKRQFCLQTRLRRLKWI